LPCNALQAISLGSATTTPRRTAQLKFKAKRVNENGQMPHLSEYPPTYYELNNPRKCCPLPLVSVLFHFFYRKHFV